MIYMLMCSWTVGHGHGHGNGYLHRYGHGHGHGHGHGDGHSNIWILDIDEKCNPVSDINFYFVVLGPMRAVSISGQVRYCSSRISDCLSTCSNSLMNSMYMYSIMQNKNSSRRLSAPRQYGDLSPLQEYGGGGEEIGNYQENIENIDNLARNMVY
jgi:hypothetical protein